MLWTIVMYELMPVEILWSMEYEKEDDSPFSDEEEYALKYLEYIANYYLKKTKKYYLLLTSDNKNSVTIFDEEELQFYFNHSKMRFIFPFNWVLLL